jgi:hypothetical protein
VQAVRQQHQVVAIVVVVVVVTYVTAVLLYEKEIRFYYRFLTT